MPISPDVSRAELDQLAALYAQAQQDILALIRDRLADGADDLAWEQNKLADIRRVRQEITRRIAALDAASSALVAQTITTAVVTGRDAAVSDLTALGVAAPRARQVAGLAGVESLIREAQGNLRASHLLAVTRGTGIYEQVIRQTAAQAVEGSVTRLKQPSGPLASFASRGVTGYTDQTGRTWSLETYVEAATRRAVARAAINAHVETLSDNGFDLAMVSDSPDECELCRPWEGRIVSLTGRTPGYLTVKDAEAAGVWHPNCTHRLGIYIEGVTKPLTGTANPQGYADRQRLRTLERQVRAAKRREAAAITPEAKARAASQIRARQAAIREHVEATGQRRKRNREQVAAAR